MNREKNSFTQQRLIELLLEASSVTGTGAPVPLPGRVQPGSRGKLQTTAAGKCCRSAHSPICSVPWAADQRWLSWWGSRPRCGTAARAAQRPPCPTRPSFPGWAWVGLAGQTTHLLRPVGMPRPQGQLMSCRRTFLPVRNNHRVRQSLPAV